MCGITGIFNTTVTEEMVQQMNAAIAHRGPDADGLWIDENIGLGHRRLSIIDLSSEANQPMHSRDGRYVMVYNGEIYNYKSVAKEVEAQQDNFGGWKTNSDSEVILEAYALWGVDFVHKLNGMFAIAIYDKQTNELYLFRDRMGIKPVFYYHKGHSFAFSSELKALMALEEIRDNAPVNESAIPPFLYLGYIPEPETIYQNIYKFPSGSYAKVKDGEVTIQKYWDINQKIQAQIYSDESDALSKLKQLVESSVEQRLVSDVPFGCFLSGGVDSSLVTAVAQKVSDNPINTFSIGFKEAKYNESVYAKEIASYLKTNHHEHIVSVTEGMDLIKDMVSVYDEPYADSSAVPTMMVSQMAKKNVTMVLSGDGGDELFGGYGAYIWAERMNKSYIRYGRKAIATALKMGDNRMKRAANVFDVQDYNNIKSHIFSQEQYFYSLKEIDQLLTDKLSLSWEEPQYKDLSRKLSPMEAQSLFDMQYYLKDDLLVKVDRASMQHSLETRVPLLDYRIVEFALNLDSSLKINSQGAKYLLKQLLYQYIPKTYFDRPKRGFAIPLAEWMQRELRPLVEQYASAEVINKYGYIRYVEVEKLKKAYFGGATHLYNRLWLLVVLHLFLEVKAG